MLLLLLAPALSSAQTNVARSVRFTTIELSRSEWPVASVSTEFAGYVTVVAITPGVDRFGVQILWPRTPADTGWLLAEQTRRLRPFAFDAVSHRVASGGSDIRPIIVGLHSPKRPQLESFIRGGDWARDAVVKVKMDSTTELLDVLGSVLYGENARFAVNLFREVVPVGSTKAVNAAGGANGVNPNLVTCAGSTLVNCARFLTPEDPGYRVRQAIEARTNAEEEANRRKAAEAKKPPGGA